MNKQDLKKLTLNKSLIMNEDYKKVITSAINRRYEYYDYSKEIIQETPNKAIEEIPHRELYPLVQTLFPEYLICSGLFDKALMFKIEKGYRVDLPKYYYRNIGEYLNNNKELKYNNLMLEIKDLFIKNDITCNSRWNRIFAIIETEVKYARKCKCPCGTRKKSKR